MTSLAAQAAASALSPTARPSVSTKSIHFKRHEVYAAAMVAVATSAGAIALVEVAHFAALPRGIFLAALAGAAMLALMSVAIVMHVFRVRRPLVAGRDELSVPRAFSCPRFPHKMIVEARWSIACRRPTIKLRAAHQRATVGLFEYAWEDQLWLIRYLRARVPARAHRDWYRFCRYALYVRRRVQIERRDTRTARESRWEAVCLWVGIMTEATLIGLFNRDAGQAHLHARMAQEFARDKPPREAFTDTELQECGWAGVGGLAILAGCVAMIGACWLAMPFAGGAIGAGAVLVAAGIYSFRRHAEFEDDVARETAPDVVARWELGESRGHDSHRPAS